jgi:hypothetical protein
MFKQLRIYYLYVSLPYVLLLLGAAVYFDAIKGTILRNPHPQINYAIFFIILVGGFLIIRSVKRLMTEALKLKEFSAAIRNKTDLATLQEMAINYNGDISYVLRMIAASGGRSISHQEQTAIERELVKAATRLTRSNALPQFLTGLLVGMGLLGTFIGLLSTLNDISALIGSFADLDMTTANPIAVFRNMIERMKAPMQSMGIAFSASLFGLLGSIILGLMMVAVRRFQSDIHSMLSSEVAQHIEFALSHEGFAYSKSALKLGLGSVPGGQITPRDVIARPTQPIDLQLAAAADEGKEQDGALSSVDGSAIKKQPVDISSSQPQAAEPAYGQADTSSPVFGSGEESKILLRIEERLAETARLQMRTLGTEVDDFQKQRADMLRTLTEQNEASNNFRSELQRVGRQLGTILNILEKSNNEISTQVTELTVRIASDSAESHKLLLFQIEEQRKLNELLRTMLQKQTRQE